MQPPPSPSNSSSHPTPPKSEAPSPNRGDDDDSDLEIYDEDLELLVHFDSLKVNYELEGEVMNEDGEAKDEEINEWEGMHAQRK